MLSQTQVQEEKYFFRNDLAVYKESEQGKALRSAFESGNVQAVEQALKTYYNARQNNAFTYESEETKRRAQETDKMLAAYFYSMD